MSIAEVIAGTRPWWVENADCLVVLPTLPAGCVDLIFTSPPFNLGGEPWPHLGNWKQGDSAGGRSKWRNGSDAAAGISYATHDDAMPHAEYVAWQREVLAACWRVLSPKGAIFYNHKPRPIGGLLWLPLELNPDLPLRQIIIWARAGGLNYNPTVYVPTHEWVMIFAKPKFRLRDRAASGLGDVWRVSQEANPWHPAPFPVELARRAIETTKADVVCDPFAGSGSTGRACQQTGRRFLGVEISPEYAQVARRRLEGRTPDVLTNAPLFDAL